MCYICRQSLEREGYTHFCQHFRERPGQACAVCEKCDLYRVEDEEVAIRRARERAESEWWEQQGGEYKVMREGVRAGEGVGGLEIWLQFLLNFIVA